MPFPKFLLPQTIIIALWLGTVPAGAATPDHQLRSIAIDASDLDLLHEADRTKLDGRIKRAARQICRGNAHGRISAELHCVAATVRAARPQRNAAIAQAFQPIGLPQMTFYPLVTEDHCASS